MLIYAKSNGCQHALSKIIEKENRNSVVTSEEQERRNRISIATDKVHLSWTLGFCELIFVVVFLNELFECSTPLFND